MKKYKETIINWLQTADTFSTAQAYDLSSKDENGVPRTINLPKELKEIATFLNDNYPLVSWCVWSFDFLKTLTQHIPADQVLFVDVEKDSQEAILYALGDNFEHVYEEKVYDTIKKSLPNGIQPVIIRTLISEAPVEVVETAKIPSLEKMLVDFAVDDLFSFLEGQEIQHIFANACERYRIHTNRLFRYASRRGRKDQIEKLYNIAVQQGGSDD